MNRDLENGPIADALDRCADLLEIQHAGSHRVRAYRTAAHSVRTYPRNVADIAREGGRDALDEAIQGVGKSIASAIEQLVRTGRWSMLDRLQGEVSVEQLLLTVPGFGETLARRVHAELGVETLEDLECAAHDGRLERVRGFGARRVRMVRQALASMLARPPRAVGRPIHATEPSVATLLELDARYRNEAARDRLPRIAPRRFNPSGEAWLPILHVDAEGFHFQALFSNTALAHKLQRTRDWVVLYFDRDGHTGQHTVVTETRGPLQGKRVVRGRESECAAYYASVRNDDHDRTSSQQTRWPNEQLRRSEGRSHEGPVPTASVVVD